MYSNHLVQSPLPSSDQHGRSSAQSLSGGGSSPWQRSEPKPAGSTITRSRLDTAREMYFFFGRLLLRGP